MENTSDLATENPDPTEPPEPPVPVTIVQASSILRWLQEGARSSVFLRPHWDELTASPRNLLRITVLLVLFAIIFDRLYIVGSANFYLPAIEHGWLIITIMAWSSYAICLNNAITTRSASSPTTVQLCSLLMVQMLFQGIVVGIIYTILIRGGWYEKIEYHDWSRWSLWGIVLGWTVFAQSVLIWRAGYASATVLRVAILIILAGAEVYSSYSNVNFWYPNETTSAKSNATLKLTQELMEAQPELLKAQLANIHPAVTSETHLYGITFAPYKDDVFKNESMMVADVMAQRFHAEGRIQQLVNNVSTAQTLPWATPLNLHRAINRMAEVMDKDKDVLFIHMTSHGASNGELAARFYPLEVQSLHPAELKTWLDEAGIKNRVISVSACFSGSWIEPLSNDDTLVMTAADADHTSYGCGSRSDLTFFGRAMYDEQLRNQTLSFEHAHQVARKVIDQREKEAGKEDGYSNPQIRVGTRIRAVLDELEKSLSKNVRPTQ